MTRAALYKPLAHGDIGKISGIVKATENFFQKLAYVFVVYAVILACCFKTVSHSELDAFFLGTLVLILSLSEFSQYYFGISYSVLLLADQRGYVNSLLQIVMTILNTLMSVVLIQLGASVHVVKLFSVSTYVIRPIVLKSIAQKQYGLLPDAEPDNEAIAQRWNGFGQHIAFYIHNNVDIMVVTTMLGLKWASVYSVYFMIVSGMKSIVNALTGAGEAVFGSMIAKNEKDLLNRRFHMVETLTSMIIVIFFTTTGVLLLDFIRIYTRGIADINYILPAVGVLFVFSEALHCVKQTYNSLVLSAGHYKETQKGAFIEAGLNLGLSVLLVLRFKLPGVLLATIAATVYRMADYLWYLKYNILHRPIQVFLRRQLLNGINVIVILFICHCIGFSQPNTYFAWVMMAIPVFMIAGTVTVLLNILFYRRDLNDIFTLLTHALKR